jgi:predicted acylesterase/phospholipase RssA
VGAETRRLRADRAFQRLALVLSGGGALGAYEIGVFRALESAGVRPRILIGVSVGAINAVAWLAHGFRTERLAAMWRGLRPASVGMRWTTLFLRFGGLVIAAVAALEVVLSLASLPELGVAGLWGRRVLDLRIRSVYLETLAWQILALLALGVVLLSRPIEDLFARLAHSPDPAWLHRWSGRVLIGLAVAYVAAVAAGIPWPSRFHLVVLLAGAAIWFLNRPGESSDRTRRLLLGLLPETGGRGLWRGSARRRLLQRIVSEGNGERLMDPGTALMMTACEVETGRIAYFVNGPEPAAGFAERVAEDRGEVVPMRSPAEVIDAAVASSAIPVVYEPQSIQGRDFVDAGLFSNQPLHAAIAAGADALLLVLVSPSASPAAGGRDPDLLDVGARMLEVANWRDLQGELRSIPQAWRAERDPARVCVVEPAAPLPGSQLGFEPRLAEALMERGEQDTWAALERAGWLEPAGGDAARAGA